VPPVCDVEVAVGLAPPPVVVVGATVLVAGPGVEADGVTVAVSEGVEPLVVAADFEEEPHPPPRASDTAMIATTPGSRGAARSLIAANP
jgi:hypothetical protein